MSKLGSIAVFAMLAFGFASAFQRSTVFSTTQTMMRSGRGQLEMYDKIFVAGAGRGVGKLLVEKLSSQGKQVVAFVRREESKTELEKLPGVTAIIGDALEQKAVENAMDGCDAAVTTLGTTPEDTVKHKADYTGNVNVFESAGILGVTRVILVTSLGCGESRAAISDEVYKVLEGALTAKQKAEKALTRYYTNSDWTVIRPGGLSHEPATGQAVLTENTSAGGMIRRGDVADLVARALEAPATHRKVYTALDPSLPSAYSEGQKELDPVPL
ncbi:unnamed protein product [Heterosigma akashiwo]